MRVGDNTRIVKMVLPIRMWKHAVRDEDITGVSNDLGESFTFWNVLVEHVLERRVKTFWVVIKKLADPCNQSKHFLVKLVYVRVTFDAILGDKCSATSGWDVREAMDDGQSIAAAIEKLSVPVVICMPPFRFCRRYLVCLPVLITEIDDELITMVPLADLINLVLTTNNLDHLVPRNRTEFSHGDFSMAREFDISLLPRCFVFRVVPETSPQVFHPSMKVFWIDGVFDPYPSMLNKMSTLFGCQIVVTSSHSFQRSLVMSLAVRRFR